MKPLVVAITEAGGTVMPGWYHGVQSIQDLIDFVVARILDQFDIGSQLIHRWGDHS